MANRMVTGTAGKKKMPKAKGHKPKGKVRHMNIEKAENGVKVDTHYLPPEGDESKYVEPSSMVFGDGDHKEFADHVTNHFFPNAKSEEGEGEPAEEEE